MSNNFDVQSGLQFRLIMSFVIMYDAKIRVEVCVYIIEGDEFDEGEGNYTGTEERNTVAMILSFGNMSHFLHRTAIRENVPLTSQPFIS